MCKCLSNMYCVEYVSNAMNNDCYNICLYDKVVDRTVRLY